MPREPRQADFRRRENLDLVPERTELSCNLTGGEPGPFREQDAHGGSLALIGVEIHVATKLRCSLMSEMGRQKAKSRGNQRISALASEAGISLYEYSPQRVARREASHGAAISCGWIGPDLPGWNALVSFQRQGELKDGAPKFVRARPHPSPVSLDHRPADREAHAHALGLRRVEGRENA